MIRILSILSLIVWANLLYGQDDNPFTQIQYDSIVIFDFEPHGETREELSIVDDKNKLASTIKKFRTLTPNESKSLSGVIGQKTSYGQSVAACFDPHLGIVYYRNGAAIGHLTICMDCNRLVSSIDIANQRQGKQVSDDGEVYFTLMGMSKKLRRHLNNLLKKHGFSHTINEKTLFDN